MFGWALASPPPTVAPREKHALTAGNCTPAKQSAQLIALRELADSYRPQHIHHAPSDEAPMTVTQLPLWVEWAKALAPTFVSALAVLLSVFTVLLSRQIAHQQTKIAERQASTALDQLRYNLFEKMYAVYDAARDAVAIAFEKRTEDKIPNELNTLFLRFEEVRYFFAPEIYLFLDQLRADIREFLQTNYNYRQKWLHNIDSQHAEIRKLKLDAEAELLELERALYVKQQNLPKTFEAALSFPQLTSPRAVTMPKDQDM